MEIQKGGTSLRNNTNWDRKKPSLNLDVQVSKKKKSLWDHSPYVKKYARLRETASTRKKKTCNCEGQKKA